MAKKKAAQQEPNTALSIFDHLDKINGVEKEKPEVDNAALLARIEAQDRMIADLQKGGQRDLPMVAPTAHQPQQSHVVDPSKMTISLDGLPNRDEDPDGYWREYNVRANAAMQAQTHSVRQQLTAEFEQQRAAERLWNGFKTAHPAWAKYESLVETVTNRVANDLQAKGVDLQRLISGQPERFYAEIENSLKQQYGRLVEPTAGEGGDDDEEDDTPLDTSDPALVAGVGGAGSGTPRGPGGKPGAQVVPDMFDDLKAMQRRMGIV